MCGCSGATATVTPNPSLTVTVSAGQTAVVSNGNGMPKFKVIGSDQAGTPMFDNYRAAMRFKVDHGGKVRVA